MDKIDNIKNKIFVLIKNNYWLIIILFTAFFIRWYGIYFDFPVGINFIWDETGNIINLIDIIETKSFLASVASPYPALLTIMYAPVLLVRIAYLMLLHRLDSIIELKNFVLLNGMGYLYIIVRWFAVAFGTATVFLLYKIFKYISKDKIAANLVATVGCCSIIPVFLSHWGKAHIVMVFFLLLSLYFSLLFEQEKKNKFFYWSSFFAGCSISIHYIGVLAIIFPLLNIIFNYKILNIKVIIKSFLIGLLVVLLFYGLNFNGVKNMFSYQDKNYYSATGYTGMSNVSLWERLTYVITDSWMIEPLLTTLFFVFFIFYFRKFWQDKLQRYLLAGIIFFYFFMITVTVLPGNNRWLLIFMTLAYPLSVFTLYNILQKKFSQKIVICLCLLTILPSFIYCLKWDAVIFRHTGIEAANWLEKNVDKNDWVYSFYYNLYLPLSYQGAIWNKTNNQLAYKKIEYILNNPEIFKDSGYNLAYDYSNNRYNELAGKQTKYVVISAGDKNDIERQYDALKKFHNLALIKSFNPFVNSKGTITNDITNNPDNWRKVFDFATGGPFINIYKVNNEIIKMGQ